MKRNALLHNAIPGNPFRYGTVVDEPFFINRVNEMAEIKQALLSGQNLILYSPRRYGKTSLIKKVLKDLNTQGYPVVFIDFFKIPSREKFIQEYSREIFRNYTSWEKALKRITGLMKSVKPVISVDEHGIPEASVKFEREEITAALDDIINLPEKLSTDKRWIVVLDEFQEIERLNGENFEKELRSAFQLHQKVSYVFMGSRKHLLTNIFTRKNRAFYNFGRLFKLDKIQPDEISKFLIKGFESVGTHFNDKLVARILDLTGNIPYFVQMLASVLWDQTAGKAPEITEDHIQQALEKSLWHQNDFYLSVLQQLTSYQQKVLQAIAKENSGIFTNDYAKRNYFSAVSSTQRAVKRLEEEDIIVKTENAYHFEDPLFRIWLLKNM
jgi:AAA+ ATPase superfamily predicted ATPase